MQLYLHPLKNPASWNSFSPISSGPTPTNATPLAFRSGSSLLTSDAIHRHTWQPNLRRKKNTTGWSCHKDWSSTFWNTDRLKKTTAVRPQNNWCHTGYMHFIYHRFRLYNTMVHITGIPFRSPLCHPGGPIWQTLFQSCEVMTGLLQEVSAGHTGL